MSNEGTTITIRDVGSNAPEDPNRVQRVDLSKGVVPFLRRIWRDEREEKAMVPAPRLAPADELKQKREQLAHYESQLAIVRERIDGNTVQQTTTIQAASV